MDLGDLFTLAFASAIWVLVFISWKIAAGSTASRARDRRADTLST